MIAHVQFDRRASVKAVWSQARQYVSRVPVDTGPRQWTTQPRLFGKSRKIEWRRNVRGADADIRAAVHQHQIIMLVRHLMQEVGFGSYDDLAQRTGLSTAQVARIMRGQSPLSLKTIAEFEVALKRPLIGSPRERDD